jgi:hypothetical protein
VGCWQNDTPTLLHWTSSLLIEQNITEYQELKMFISLFISILWLYQGYIVTFTKVLTVYLRLIFPICLFILPPPFLEQFQWMSLFHFHTWIYSTSTMFALLHPFLMPSDRYQLEDIFYRSVLYFKKNTSFFIMTFPFMCYTLNRFILSIILLSTLVLVVCVLLGLELRAYTLSHSTTPFFLFFCVIGFSG